jgi:hypothetical protein
MKKLIVLMVFVLLFSINMFAGDLSKEEIINELEKITVVTNKDIRLEMYDILAGKLGLKVADDPIIKEYSGNGMQTTRPFVVKTSWEMQWDTKPEDFMMFQVYLYDGDGNLIGVAANQTKPGKGSFYNPKKGTFYLTINAICDWEIKIVEVK